MKISKFLICENPIADKSDGKLFIIHTRDPFILAQIFSFENPTESEVMDCQRLFEVGSKLDYPPEVFVLGAIKIFPSSSFLSKSSQIQADTLASIMRRMADWYEAYLIWEDSTD